MPAGMPRLAPSPAWTLIDVGSPQVAVAERDALGTTARLAIWPRRLLRGAIGAIDRELTRLDLAASRFRPDSEICQVQARASGVEQQISDSLAEVIGVALAAASWTGGLVDPTVGAALVALGYDKDFVLLGGRQADAPPAHAEVPGWRSVSLDGRLLRLPAGIQLDFGATAKGLGADWAARAAHEVAGRGGVLVGLGGDVASAGEAPVGGWPILIADNHLQTARSRPRTSPTQVVRLRAGAVATSSTACRQWRRAGRLLHHIVDPGTGEPVDGPWRTVSVAAATCAEANAAATAAIVSGHDAASWLSNRKMPARLVSHGGEVLCVAGWPDDEGRPVPVPPAWLPAYLDALPCVPGNVVVGAR
jgi:FAD:protein FMN transferase